LGYVMHAFHMNCDSIHDAVPLRLDLDEGYLLPFGGCEPVYKHAFRVWKEKDYIGPVFTKNIYEMICD